MAEVQEKQRITKAYLEELKQRLDYLERVERPRNLEELTDARAQGDLSENADYHAAKDQQAKIEEEIRSIRYTLENYELIDIQLYTLYFEDRKITETYEIVGTQEADPASKKISIESPVGKAIEGHKKGDRVIVHANNRDFYVEIKDIK